MKVKAYVLDDLTALIGREDILRDYVNGEGRKYGYADRVKDKVDLEVPDYLIKRFYRGCPDVVAEKYVLGIYEERYEDPVTGEEEKYYKEPLHVIFDSSTYQPYNGRLNQIIMA